MKSKYSMWLDEKYECQDGHALDTENNLAVLCPPHDEVISRNPSVLNSIPSLSPSTTIGKHYKGNTYLHIQHCLQ